MMTRVLACGVVVAASLSAVSAQQRSEPPAGEGRPGRAIAAQQLAWAAYPELRGSGVQVRVEDRGDAGATITFGIVGAHAGDRVGVRRDGGTAEAATRDADDRPAEALLARSAPRTALLVIEAAFDQQDRIATATLRGSLARTAARRAARASGAPDALERANAAYPPAQRAALLATFDRDLLTGIVGRLQVPAPAVFQRGGAEDGLYWEVVATSETGERVTLGYEAFGGRLVRFARGGGR